MVCAFVIFLILLGFFTYEVIAKQNQSDNFPIALFITAVVIGLILLSSLAYVMLSQLLFFKRKFLMKKKYGELSFKEKVAFISVFFMVSLIVICLFTTIGQWLLISVYKGKECNSDKCKDLYQIMLFINAFWTLEIAIGVIILDALIISVFYKLGLKQLENTKNPFRESDGIARPSTAINKMSQLMG